MFSIATVLHFPIGERQTVRWGVMGVTVNLLEYNSYHMILQGGQGVRTRYFYTLHELCFSFKIWNFTSMS